MSINLLRINDGMITPKDDALLYDFFAQGSGITEGCTVTSLGANQLQIAAGRGMIKGRDFVISSQTILATLSTSGEINGRLIIKVDLANTDTPISFVTQAASTLPALTQEDINRDGTVYELPVVTYHVDETQVTDLAEIAASHLYSSSIGIYGHSRTGTVNALVGTGSNGRFLATADFIDGDTFTLNGTSYDSFTQDGEEIQAGYFKSGFWTTFIFDGTQINFKSAAGAGGEVFNFPVTIASTEPTPKAAGHLWVHHATPADFTNIVLDKVVKVDYTNGYLMLIVDDTNNGQDTITQNKNVGGTKIPFTSHRDTVNDTTLPWQAGYTNKPGNIIDIKRKYPRVYSRLGDVLDLETASVWDGTQWVLVSQQGSYLAVGTTGTPYSDLYNRTGSSLAIHAGLPSFPAGQVNAVKFSLDGHYVFYGLNVSPWLVGYKRSGDVFTQLTLTVTTGTYQMNDIDFSPDGNYLAVAGTHRPTSTTQAYCDIYKKQIDGTWTFLSSVYSEISSSNAYGCSWSPDGNYITIASSLTPFIHRYKRTGDTFTQLANPTTLPTATCYKCKYSPDGNFVAVRTAPPPCIICYHIISDTVWDKIADPSSSSSTGTQFSGIVFTPYSGYLLAQSTSSSALRIYTYSSSGLVDAGTIATGTSGILSFAVSQDGTKLAIGYSASPYFRWYSLIDTSVTLLSSPTTMPTSQVNSLDFLN